MSSPSLVNGADQPQVKLLSRETVLPASPSPPHPFFLSCLDILWQDLGYIRGLLFYRSPGVPSLLSGQHPSDERKSFTLLQQLKRSLSLCLVHYHCWCGRLAKGADPPHRLFIDCNDAGVEFVEASIDMPLSLLAQDGFQMKTFFDQLCQAPDHRGECLFSSPLLSVQATVFSDGGLALGVAHNHVVADGLSLWQFMVSWGECARGVPFSVPPLHDRQRLAVPSPSLEMAQWSFFPELSEEEKADLEVEISREANGNKRGKAAKGASTAVYQEKTDIHVPGGADKNGNDRTQLENAGIRPHDSSISSVKGDQTPLPKLHGASLVQRVFTLSASAIKKLKSEAGEGYSSFEVICAYFWQRISVARKAPAGQCTSVLVPINFRTQIKPPLPPSYFGNVLASCLVASLASRIREESLGATVSRIRNQLAAVKETPIDPFMHWLETHDNRLATAFNSSPWPQGKGLHVSNSPRFPAYEVDFGWGKPAALRVAKVAGEGVLIFLGARPGSNPGDMEICTALPADVLHHLLQDPIFVAKPPCPSSLN